jgi:hypothetical protein
MKFKRINAVNACYYSSRKLLSSSLFFKTFKEEDIKNNNFASSFHGCEKWYLLLEKNLNYKYLKTMLSEEHMDLRG